ncbi:4-hydroxyacetophenone monooxygenase [Streptomyces brevispora]|uniref:4-hydroxyacetophenone monooxygenase n=1 Tax=Streptomyces brevispora TaxID=887462 RepID=A0A561V3R1_9ACTN|nr:NAD(P)/FAD-dependent oxidoreductase [Streptomyces brevispora]TWG06237.1 4-hydroxyacetophenone monooxygenase [Streptomyces brevispora]
MTDPSEVTRIDDVYWRDEYPPITEDDAFLTRIVAEADLPSLLTALAALTGDHTLIPAELYPPLPPVDTAPPAHGGMSGDAQARARELALSALKRVRDEGLTRPRLLEPEEARAVVDFITGGASAEDAALMMHELDLVTQRPGAPIWHADEVAPDRDFDVAVIGTGMSGIAAMYRLKQAGVRFVVFEKSPEVGGTWWANTYPGVRLDTPTFGYSFSFAQRADWASAYAEGAEIEAYSVEIVDRAKLREHIEFETEVVSMTWDEASAIWEVVVRRDGVEQHRRFHAVVAATGQLEKPNIPQIPGQDDFGGVRMHSARWNHDVDLTGKRVAVVGTGASAYQIVPSIIDRVAHLDVFQRSGPWTVPAPNYHDPTPPALAWLSEHVPHYGQWFRFQAFWGARTGRLHTVEVDPEWDRTDSVSAANLRVREALTAIMREQWADRPDMLDVVIPAYPPGGKRMLRDNGVWARALHQEHAELVTSPIERFTSDGIVTADGEQHPVDVVIYATGFKASDYLDPIVVTGPSGQTLKEHWNGDATAWAGICVPGFPNLFLIQGPNTNYVVHGQFHFMIECGVEFTVEAIHQLLRRDAGALEVGQETLERFLAWVDQGNAARAWGQPQVHTWYKNARGRVSQVWPYSHLEYWQLTRGADFDAGFTLRPRPGVAS